MLLIAIILIVILKLLILDKIHASD